MDRDSELSRDRLGQRDLGLRPGSGLRAVETEHSDHPVEHEDGRPEHGERVEVQERLDAAELRGPQLGRLADVADGHRSPLSGCKVRARRAAPPTRPTGAKPSAVHSAANRHRRGRISDAEEAAAHADRNARGLDGDPEHIVQVELGPDFPADRGYETFALERVGQLVRRARPVEPECRLGRERLEQRQARRS